MVTSLPKKILTTTSEMYRRMDMFGGKPELRISGDSAFRTKFGATLTLLAAVGIIAQIMRTYNRLTDKSQPSVMTVSDMDMEKAVYDITNSGLIPVFVTYNKYTGQLLNIEEMASMITMRAIYRTARFSSETKKVDMVDVYIPIIDCLQLANPVPYKDIYNYEELNGYRVCLDIPTNVTLNIAGDRSSHKISSLSSLRIEVLPCSLADSTKCDPMSRLAEYSVGMGYNKQYISFPQFDNPIKRYYYFREEINLMPTTGTVMLNFIKQAHIYDQTSAIFDASYTGSLIQIAREELGASSRPSQMTCTTAMIDAFQCFPYYAIEYRSCGLTETFTRVYPDFFSVFAEVGGFKEVLLTCICITYVFYNGFFKDRHIRSEILDIPSVQSLLALSEHRPTILSPGTVVSTTQAAVTPSSRFGKQRYSLGGRAGKGEGEERKDKEASKEMGELIERVIDENSSLSTIVKELAAVKVIKEILFDSHHVALLPLVELEIERKKMEKEKVCKVPFLRSLTRHACQAELAKGKDDMKTAMDTLFQTSSLSNSTDSSERKNSTPLSPTESLRSKIDQFFISHLTDLFSLAPQTDPRGVLSNGYPSTTLSSSLPRTTTRRVRVHPTHKGEGVSLRKVPLPPTTSH